MLKQPEVVCPIVHMNGTSKDALIGGLCLVREKLEEAYQALKEASPNGRDYYPVAGLMDKAVEQHMARMRAIDAIVDGLDAEIDAIDKQ